jgi:FkbM family methyltransferase
MWDYLASLKEDDVFVDVGAHIGLYSIYAASLLRQGKVVAIEPNPKNYKALFKAIQLNRLKNVVALNIAAWSKECRLPLYIKGSSDPHSLVSKSSKYIIVRAMKLDDCINKLGLKKISLIKIDVEGAEVQVIDGLCNTLRAHRPKLVVEVTWSNINIIYRLLGEFGYSFFIIPASAFKDICYIYAWPNN